MCNLRTWSQLTQKKKIKRTFRILLILFEVLNYYNKTMFISVGWKVLPERGFFPAHTRSKSEFLTDLSYIYFTFYFLAGNYQNYFNIKLLFLKRNKLVLQCQVLITGTTQFNCSNSKSSPIHLNHETEPRSEK